MQIPDRARARAPWWALGLIATLACNASSSSTGSSIGSDADTPKTAAASPSVAPIPKTAASPEPPVDPRIEHVHLRVGPDAVTVSNRAWAARVLRIPGTPPPEIIEQTITWGDDRDVRLATTLVSTLARIAEIERTADGEPDQGADLSIDPSLTTDDLLGVWRALGRSHRPVLRYEVHTPRGATFVTAPGVMLCGCMASEPIQGCVHVQLRMQAEGALVSAWPRLRGPCRNAMLSAAAADEGRDARPFEGGRLVLRDRASCPEGVPEPRPLDDALEVALRRVHAIAPGCDYADVAIGPGLRWTDIDVALALVAVELGWEPRLVYEPDPSAIPPCEDALLEDALPPPWSRPEVLQRSDGKCRDSE